MVRNDGYSSSSNEYEFSVINVVCLVTYDGECNLSSPVMIANREGTPFPMFVSWLSTASMYLDVFSGPVSSFARGALASASGKSFRDVTLLKAVDGVAGVGLKGNARRSRRTTMMVTSLSHVNANFEKPVQAVWLPKTIPDVTVQAIATSGNRSEEGHLLGEKAPEKIPVSAIEGSYRASIVR
uniref:Uncharacterized protein n=1 Tax=Cannabis sativa TaxID=3483 RepID=A0A803NM47_CANSA